MKLITISGLDGSGKSTQIKLLQEYLTSQGKKVFYFHAIKFGIARKIANLKRYCLICRLLGKCKVKKNRSVIIPRPLENDTFSVEEKSVTKANGFQILLRKIFLKIDSIRFKKLVARLEKEGYDYLISDRYFYDNVVNIEYLTNFSHCKRPPAGEAGSEVPLSGTASPVAPRNDIIRPAVAIYLQTSPEIIMQRECIPDQGIEYLQNKKEIYDKYAESWKLQIVNGNRDKEEIFEEIKKEISNSPDF